MALWDWESASRLKVYSFLDLMYRAQRVHQMYQEPNKIQVSTLCSIKTGLCPEDCKYCPQSAHYNTGLKAEGLIDLDRIVMEAERAKRNGSHRFCIGAAWRSLHDKDLDTICRAIDAIGKIGLESCATLGMVTLGQAKRMKAAGLDYYNHNIDTSEEYYGTIVGTRKFGDRIRTLNNIAEAGLKICCGGIVGMGESEDDRIKMLMTLANLQEPPKSVPINMLVKVKGTPLGGVEDLDPIEFVRTVAYARIMLPNSFIRLSAGRSKMSLETQTLCFLAGANSVFYGEKLLTTGNNRMTDDEKMFGKLGLKT